MDPWQEEIYRLFSLFHAMRRGGFGPEPFSVGEMDQVLRSWGYRDVEYIIDLLVALDVTYRVWYQEESKKKDG